ncbi:MAG TPA: EthD family reductase [Vicinamibacteria bacterium]|nr:EthD family reductase [Vicinamibacteria bacterium]
MSGAKLVVCYPHPKDSAAFEKAYAEEHLPMAGPILARAGAQKAVLTRLSESPQGKPHFYRIAEIHFPSAQILNEALASPDVQRAVADANRISTGGPVVAMISGEDQTITF